MQQTPRTRLKHVQAIPQAWDQHRANLSACQNIETLTKQSQDTHQRKRISSATYTAKEAQSSSWLTEATSLQNTQNARQY